MPRKQFVADLGRAKEGSNVAGISDVKAGEDDGMFTFKCLADGEPLQVSVLVMDVSDYPSSHPYMIFAPDHAPAAVVNILTSIAEEAFGKNIQQLLELVARKLDAIDQDGDQQMLDSQEYDGLAEEDSDEEVDDFFSDDDLVQKPFVSHAAMSLPGESYVKPTSIFRSRIRKDLALAKANGFKVGHLGGLMDGLGCYVSISCRISKLGISEEAMAAWQLEPSEYLVVIFSYPNGYKSMDTVRGYDMPTARRNFGMRIGISTTYKPTMQEAVRAFTVLSKDEEKRREEESQTESQSATIRKGFRNSFISRPLNELLEDRFPQLLKYRYNGMPWHGAEEFYREHIGSSHKSNLVADTYMAPEQVSLAYPPRVTSDHIQEALDQEHSLPLVGMQFVLRHFVRCTEFCLICFAKLSDDLQAIKPYVCDNPLCLYQYMSLGFGPSIEHEIISQPKVVDLLISFCYASARAGKLAVFPSGLSLMVPPTVSYASDYQNLQQRTAGYALEHEPLQNPAQTATKSGAQEKSAIEMRFNTMTNEILFEDKNMKCPIRHGDWLVIRTIRDGSSRSRHCRVVDTSLFPTVRVAEPISPTLETPATTTSSVISSARPGTSHASNYQPNTTLAASPAELSKKDFEPATFFIYNQNFDDFNDFNKREAIYALLDILPSVADMKTYLHRKAQSPLSSWVDRLPPAALGLLRWIIASNRACIMQVEEEDDTELSALTRKGKDRLFGMQGWSQFRFAMGAPDKERRFIQGVRETGDRLKLKFPTLFAWHGSPLHNWHSIIREGLHFRDTAHGRAFGHGVYHSLDWQTSIGYSGAYSGGSGIAWPVSELKISQALALNEVVNAPMEYVSSAPHLVVAQLDWIQTRYLFVKTGADTFPIRPEPTPIVKETKPFDPIEQDPKYTPRGVLGNLVIPKSAISGSRRPKSRPISSTTKNKRRAASGSSVYDPTELDADDDDGVSVATLEEDLVVLEDEDVHVSQTNNTDVGLPTPNSTKGKSKASGFLSRLVGSKSSTSSKPLTDYVPGTLDYDSLPMLKPPDWATSSATKRLLGDFKQLITVQNREPPHELGWHIDEDKIENMYQWIIELHSFDPTLPLAQDMKQKGHKSIVLELRFGKDYPMSPPFVRVIRPRFLGFQQGGGGHVTAGGALCMELLTNSGWSAVSSIESILLQVRMAMSSLDPKPARLENGGRSDYGIGEAVDAYIRSCNMHGWAVPAGFKEMAYGGSNEGPAYRF